MAMLRRGMRKEGLRSKKNKKLLEGMTRAVTGGEGDATSTQDTALPE